MTSRSLTWIVLSVLGQSLFAQEPAPDLRWQQLAPFFSPPAEWSHAAGRSPLLFEDGRRAETAEQWQQRRREILKRWHEILGPWPALVKEPVIERLSPAAAGDPEHVRVQIAQDQWAEGYLIIPDGSGPFPAVIVPYYEPETSIGRSEQKLRDFGLQLSRRGFVTLSIGSPGGDARKPATGEAVCQPLSYLAYLAANCLNALARLPEVDGQRIGIVGHSYGGKWAMFAACLYEKFACGVWSDPGIVFDEQRPNVNYWEPWYLGAESGKNRTPGIVTPSNPRTGAYKRLVEEGDDLHELLALMAPRPFLVSGGSEDPPSRWTALNHCVQVNQVLGVSNRVAMTNRPGHSPTDESNEIIYLFFEHFLRDRPAAQF